MLIENIIMKLCKGNFYIVEIIRNLKIMEDVLIEIIEYWCIEWNIVKKIVLIIKLYFVYWY